MESIQNIKSRLKAVKNVGKITKAMEIVAATKMRRAQEVAMNSRPYAFKALEVLEKVIQNTPMETPLTKARPVKKNLAVLVASDKGLTGSFNAQVFRVADKILEPDFSVVAVGKKATAYAKKSRFEVVENFYGFGDFVRPEEISPLADFVIKGFEDKKWDRVITISTHFRTALKQEVLIRQVLPVDFKKIRETVDAILPEHGRYVSSQENTLLPQSAADEKEIDYIFEPSSEKALNYLVPHLVKMQIYHLILESNASEHSARRVAMKTASDNADDLSNELTLFYNKARQAGITNEIIEITSAHQATA